MLGIQTLWQKRTQNDVFNFTFDANALDQDIKRITSDLKTRVSDVIVPRYFQQLQRIASEAAEIGRVVIKTAYTETGKRRAAAGNGQPGRVVKGDMYDGFGWKITKVSKGEYEVSVGWLDNPPDYTLFQEFGFTHRSGMQVAAMDALGAAERYIENEIAKLK